MADIAIDLIITLTTTVIRMGMNAKANKERCQRVAKRVTSLQELVLKLKDRDPTQISDLVRKTLNELSATLVIAQDTMQKYQQNNKVKNFILNGANEDKFLKINERLDDTFQILSGALQIQHGDMLKQVLNAVAGEKNEITEPRQPFPIGFSNMCAPSHLPSPALQSPTSPTPTPDMPEIVPAITVTPAPNPPYSAPNPPYSAPNPPYPALNPPYPPAQRPAHNPNTLSVPTIRVTVPCPMPPRVVSVRAPPAVRPIMTMPGVYGTLPLVTRPASSVIYAQAMPQRQILMTVPQPRQVVTVVMTRPNLNHT